MIPVSAAFRVSGYFRLGLRVASRTLENAGETSRTPGLGVKMVTRAGRLRVRLSGGIDQLARCPSVGRTLLFVVHSTTFTR